MKAVVFQSRDGKMMLCNQCIHRLDEGRNQTACEAVCQARAIFVGTTDEISKKTWKVAAERAVIVKTSTCVR
jgi:Fe-S-cluster-containing dehydrogenase component